MILVTGNTSNVEQPSACTDTGSVGKENTSGSKVELSVERQQMKKKKKNAGFNLRKSLAWDRAFSTEEAGLEPGVLDSTELSKITGNACLLGGDMLSAIQEEAMSASKFTNVSPGLQALEENLFNDLPVNSKRREKKIVIGTVPKYSTPSKAQSSSMKKVSAQDLRSGSKRSGCPRPPPPANVHTTTPRSREPSVSKVSKTKSDPVSNNMTKITRSPSKPKLSQLTQSSNSQRSLGSVSFSKGTSSTKSKTSSSVASRSSIPNPSLRQSRRNVITKTSGAPSASKSQHSVAGKSNDGPMTTSEMDMLGHASNIANSDLTNMGTALAQNSRVGNTQSAVSRLAKPSGLRLPSPSIGYFDQSGSQPSHSAEEKHNQLPKSDIGSASRFSLIPTSKKPQFSEKVPRVNSKSATGNIGSSGPAAGFSAQERVKIGLKSTWKIESEVSSCSKVSQINESLQHPCIFPGDICTSENISTAKCEDFQSSSKLPLSRMSDDNTDEQRKTLCSVEGPFIKGSMDSPVQGPSGDELPRLQVRNQEEDVCTMNAFNEDLDTLDVHLKPQKECVHPGDEDGMSHFLSGENDVLIINHSTENVAKQSEVLDSLTSDPGPADAPDCVQSSCSRFEENTVLDSVPCGHNIECDGQAVVETEKGIDVSDSTETNCEADFVDTSDVKDVYVMKQTDQLETSDRCCPAKDVSATVFSYSNEELEDNSELEDMDLVTESDSSDEEPDGNLNLKQVNLVTELESISDLDEFPIKGVPDQEYLELEAIHTAMDQRGKPNTLLSESIGSPASLSGDPESLNQDTVFSRSSEGRSSQDSNSGCIVCNYVGEAEGQTDTEKDFSTRVTGQEFASHEEGEVQVTKISRDPVEYLTREEESGAPIIMKEAFSARDDMQPDEFTVLSDDTLPSESGKDSSAQVTDQELGSYGDVEVQVIKISPDPVVYVTREEEPRTPMTTNEAFSVRDDIQPDDDNLTSESNEVHASGSSSDRTCLSEGKDKTVPMDAKSEKKPDPIIVKPPNAVPFSDEWLAAIEAAGEEILTLKSGRVQHSPTDKTVPEPGPWSPVKKKNNQGVGPFDCTKYTNKEGDSKVDLACVNPDCLYLHEVGSQEDNFTKDEIIYAHTLGSHIANQQSLATSVISNRSTEIQRTTSVNGTLAFSAVVANAAHGPVSTNDVLKRLSSSTDSSYDGRDLANHSATVNSFDDTDEAVEEDLFAVVSQMEITTNLRDEHPDIEMAIGSKCDQGSIRQPVHEISKSPHLEQCRVDSANTDEKATPSETEVSYTMLEWGWRSDLQSQRQVSSKWDVEDISNLEELRSSTLKLGNLLKQHNSQSRFSFARYEEPSNQGFERENRSIYGQVSRDQPIPESIVVSRDIYRDNLGSVNGFASNYSGGLESFTTSLLHSSYKAPISRPQVSAPPGFSAPSKLPPHVFSSHERVRLSSDSATTVGKGMINIDLDMRSGFSSQINSFGNETGLQMLRQQSMSAAQQVNGFHHNLRNLSPSPTDPCIFSSRLMDHQTQRSTLSHFSKLQRQQPSANPVLSNCHWDKWNEGQSLKSLGIAELLRNERLGFNGSLYSNGYEEPKFRIPSPGDAYNRTYGILVWKL
ncbi:LOW QUALITY PROTEIN: hypothetical protein HID58_038682 [Brassica napus]|uniref:Uncharacterized protein n=1 Tax=Brassica napus TaxID=3708 RepID=A0ABQ8BPU3_BRANA|nr:LOW QUALITY PROTEIN: hypothetical protein HID58_038682 [Brassica napus]